MQRLQQSCPPSGLRSQCHGPIHEETDTSPEKHRKRKPATKHRTKVRGPMLARVIIQDSSKPPRIAMVKPGDGRKSKPGSSNVSSRADSAVQIVASTLSLPPYDEAVKNHESASRPTTNCSDIALESLSKHEKIPVGGLIESRTSRSGRSTSRLRAAQPRQPKDLHALPAIVLPRPNEVKKSKTESNKHYSFMSASTKLGEIPLHKWPVPFDFDAMSLMNKDAEKNGWPVYRPMSDSQAKKKRFGIFRFFRKNSDDA